MTGRDGAAAGGGLLMADEADGCPVCSGPAQEDVCPRCGWTLFTGYQLGGLTEVDLRAFDERLARAKRQHHLGYAALAAGYPGQGDAARLRRLAAVVTGGPPGEADLRAARETAARLAAAAQAGAGSATGTVPAEGSLIDIGADGLTRTTWEHGDAGPVEQADFTTWPWRSLLPGLAAGADTLTLALAGGQGLTPAELSGLRATAAAIAADAGTVPPLFVCNRLAGWVVPQALLAAIRETRQAPPLAPSQRDRPAAITAPGPLTAVAAVATQGRLLVASGGSGGEVRLQAADVTAVADANGAHRGRVTALALAEDSGLVISGGRDGVVLSWDTGLPVGAGASPSLGGRLAVTLHRGWVTVVRTAGGRVYSLADDGWLDCSVRDGRAWRTRFTTGVGVDCSLALAVTPDGALAAAAGNGGRVRLMNGATGELSRWIDVGAPVTALAMTGQALAAATPGGVLVYDLGGRARGGQWHAGGEANCLDAGVNGEVATGDANGFVRVFRAPGQGRAGQAGEAVQLFAGRHRAAVRAVRLIGDGRLVSADVEGLIRVWSYRAGD